MASATAGGRGKKYTDHKSYDGCQSWPCEPDIWERMARKNAYHAKHAISWSTHPWTKLMQLLG